MSHRQGRTHVRLRRALGPDRERSRALETAARHYRRAVTLTFNDEIKARAFNALAEVYDAKHLNQLDQVEQTLRELVALQPNELTNVFRLARAQEDQQLMAAAEDTLLAARREHPDVVDPYMMLAQFYSRRVLALQKEQDPQKAPAVASPGQPDENGVYTVGGGVSAPLRVGLPRYPPDALAAGIQGVVIAEIVVNEAGNVADAKILRSVPLLDEAALQAVRTWQYSPTVVDGQAVPVKLIVTVNFSRPPGNQSAPQSPR